MGILSSLNILWTQNKSQNKWRENQKYTYGFLDLNLLPKTSKALFQEGLIYSESDLKIFSLLKILNTIWNDWVTERWGRVGGINVIRPLTHSAKGHNSWGWTALTPGARKSSHICHKKFRLKQLDCPLARSSNISWAAETSTGTYTGYWHLRQPLSSLCYNIGPGNVFNWLKFKRRDWIWGISLTWYL